MQLDVEKTIVEQLQDRHDGIREWLSENAPMCDREQAHLESDTSERVYWHYGFAVALRDVLALLSGGANTLKN